MVAFVMKRLEFFNREDVEIYATGTTGKRIVHAGVEKVVTLNSGPMGGDAEIGAMVLKENWKELYFSGTHLINTHTNLTFKC